MTKKKATEVVVVHKVYTARHAAGSSKTRNRIFGKCLCGAVLEGQEAVDEHLLLTDGPRDNKSVGSPHGPSETHPTAKAG